jgi:hypothetical protein
MFKKKCKRCNNRISKKFKFCPNCGFILNKSTEKDYGLLGLDDSQEQQLPMQQQENSILEKIGSGMLNKMLTSSIKMLEKEMRKEANQSPNNKPNFTKMPKTNFQLYVNGKKININEKNIPQLQTGQTRQTTNNQSNQKKQQTPRPSRETLKASAKLPRKEPKSKLQRIRDKVVYELDVPGVYELDQILINKLEDSTEIKAYSKDKVYTKILPIKLALISYYLKHQKLFLEFQGK